MNLQRYHDKHIVLLMDVQGRDIVLHGTIAVRKVARQGNMLQVTVDPQDDGAVGCPIFLISEDRWKRQIASGIAYDSEFMLDLSQGALAVG